VQWVHVAEATDKWPAAVNALVTLGVPQRQ